MKKNKALWFLFAGCLVFMTGCTKSCEKREPVEKPRLGVFFEAPKDNEKVTSPVKVFFGVVGKTVRPALEDVNDKTSGHHHIMIDHPAGYVEKGLAIPVDARHIHYGKGETNAMVELPPGIHTLSLQFGDGAHLSYGKEMSATITVTVIEPDNNNE